MRVTFDHLQKAHPCFTVGAKPAQGRIHLPVSPGCNLYCNFCRRAFNTTEDRPGVARAILTPDEALAVVRKAVLLCPALTVVGVAGPGDPLATPHALETFRLLKEEFPGLLKCLSTNGLLLPDLAAELVAVGIDSLTVTVNAVAPELLARICAGLVYRGRRYTGQAAAELLISNQLAGIEMLAAAGTVIKVNTVLIPEINAAHVPVVAKTVAARGAKVLNIIPLLPQYKLSWCSAPGCDLIRQVRAAAEKYIPVFRHCQRCRADAVGIPGGPDLASQIYQHPASLEPTFSHG